MWDHIYIYTHTHTATGRIITVFKQSLRYVFWKFRFNILTYRPTIIPEVLMIFFSPATSMT